MIIPTIVAKSDLKKLFIFFELLWLVDIPIILIDIKNSEKDPIKSLMKNLLQ